MGVFLLLCIGIGLFYQFEKQLIQQEVVKNIETGFVPDDLLTFHVSKAEIDTKFRWIHSREFEYNDAMYDIVERHETADSVELICFLDDKETKLLRRMEKMKRYVLGLDTDDEGPENRPRLNVKLPFLFLNQLDELSFNLNVFHDRLEAFKKISLYQSIYFPPLSPPPNNS